jgi:Fic family protein
MKPIEKGLLELNELCSKFQKTRSFESWSEDEKENLKNNLTYHSSKIEGLTLDYGDTIKFLRDSLVLPGTRIKDLYDLKNHKAVLDKIFSSYDRLLLTEELVKELHAELMKDDAQWEVQDVYLAGPGEYKTENNYTNRPGGFHMYLEFAEVPKAMRQLIGETSDHLKNADLYNSQRHPLTIIARFHFKFLEIHPFSDGNGRMARLLTTLMLIKYGFPPIIIEGDEREEYFDALIKSEQDPVQAPIISFFLVKMAKAIRAKMN